jgi:RHS repeat-associated protein
LLLGSTSCVHPAALKPRAGSFQYQRPLLYEVPGGVVNVAGGNLSVRRVDLSIDTRLGTREIAAVYNSASGAWIRSFELRYDGRRFTDGSGAVHDLLEQPFGSAIPGSMWVRVDERRIKTKGGLIHTFSDVDGGLERVNWLGQAYPSLVYVRSTLAGVDRITSVEQCASEFACELVYSIGYDEFGCVDRIEDRALREARFESDASCRVSIARDGLDVEMGWAGRRYEYEGSLLTSVTSSEEERVEYAYVRGRLRRVTAIASDEGVADRSYWFSYVYNGTRELYASWVEDPRGGTTIYRYDGEGRIVELFDAAEEMTYWAWDGMRPRSKVEPGGVRTRWEYEDDDATHMVLPSGNGVDVEYAPEAVDRDRPDLRPWTRISDTIGMVEEREYDASGRLIARTNGAGERMQYGWSSENQLESITWPSGSITFYIDYGEHGHPGTVKTGNDFTRRLHDVVGNRLSGGEFDEGLRPSGSGVALLGYDADRNVVSADLVAEEPTNGFVPVTHTLSMSYRSDGQRTRIDRPYGGAAEFVYDGFGELAERRERVDGSWVATRFERNAAGDVTASELANGMRREMDYDTAGHPVAIRLLREGTLEKELEISWRNGRPESRRDSSYALPEVFEYDAAGRLLRTHFPDGEMLEVTHDLRSRETARRFWTGSGGLLIRSLAFGYDGADRQTRVLDEGEVVIEKEIVDGRVALIRYGNGLTRSFEYREDVGALQYTETRDALGLPLAETELEWLACGEDLLCVAAASHTDDVGDYFEGGSTGSFEAYALGPKAWSPTGQEHGMRVLSWLFGGGAVVVGSLRTRLGFDALGNWVGTTTDYGAISRASFTFNAEHNRLLSSDRNGHHDYAYDQAGYLVQRDETPLTWDAAGKLASIGDSVTLEWDILGRPIRSIVDGAESRSLFGGEIQANAQRQPVALDLGEVHIDLTSGERRYRHYDFRNNVAFVTNDAGHPIVRYQYSTFGVEQVFGGEEGGASFAQGRDLGGFIMLGARVYDPETGRFISPDPVYGELNQYSYTAGNTVFFWDPGGLWTQQVVAQGLQAVVETLVLLLLVLIGVSASIANIRLTALLLFLFLMLLIVLFLLVVTANSLQPGSGSLSLPDGMESSQAPIGMTSVASSSLCAPRSLVLTNGQVGWEGWLLLLNLLLGLSFIARRRQRP